MTKKNVWIKALLLICILYFCAIVLANLGAECFYSDDVYADVYVARLMAEGRTLFPKNWVFGNQYYIVATPVLSALFYLLVGDSSISMALASISMTVMILLLFYNCLYKYVEKISMVAGLCAISGGIMIGTGINSCMYSFQVLYTMASYYACYLVGILLSLIIYLRLYNDETPRWWIIAIACAINFALGMHSPREMLSLNLPLLVTDVAVTYSNKKICIKRHVFVVLILLLDLLGMIYVKTLDINAVHLIADAKLSTDITEIISNFILSFNDFITLTGLLYYQSGIKYIPLTIAAAFNIIQVVCSTLYIAIKKDKSPIAVAVLFSLISVLAVLAAGTLVIRTRPIYYFVWFLLSAFSVAYIVEKTKEYAKMQTIFLALLFVCATGNLFYNTYQDAVKYSVLKPFCTELAEKLEEKGISYTYSEENVLPWIASNSHDKIIDTLVKCDNSGGDVLFRAYAYLKDSSLVDNIVPDKSCIVLAVPLFSDVSSYDLIANKGEDYCDKVLDKLTLELSAECKYIRYDVYSFSDSKIIADCQ